jgi:hypothetical protein
MIKEGIEFRTNVEVGKDIDPSNFFREYDAILVATGAAQPRDLNIPSTLIKACIGAKHLKIMAFSNDFSKNRSQPQRHSFCHKLFTKLATTSKTSEAKFRRAESVGKE